MLTPFARPIAPPITAIGAPIGVAQRRAPPATIRAGKKFPLAASVNGAVTKFMADFNTPLPTLSNFSPVLILPSSLPSVQA